MKKHGKYLVSLLLAIVLMLAIASIPAMAGTMPETCTVTFRTFGGVMAAADVSSGHVASKFEGYQLMTLETSLKEDDDCESQEKTHTVNCYEYAYVVQDKYAGVLRTALGLENDADSAAILQALKAESKKTGFDAQDFADAVYAAIKTAIPKIDADKTIEGTDSSVTSTIAQGYWLFADVTEYTGTDTVKSLVLLDTRGETDLTIAPKQSIPEVDKKILEGSTTSGSTSANIGDEVTFQITGTLPEYLEYYDTYKYVFHDTLSKGLTIDEDSVAVTVKHAGDCTSTTATIDRESYDVDTSTNSDGTTILTVTFNDINSVAAIDSVSDTIILTYSATLNKDAVIGNSGNPNTVYLEYSNDPYTNGTGKTTTTEVKVFTYSFQLVKTKSDNTLLTGAKFELYDAATGDGKIDLVQEADGSYRVATSDEKDVTDFTSAVIEAGNVTIKGLKGDTSYWLEETKAPDGYNKLENRVAVTIEAANLDATVTTDTWVAGGVHVVNNAGAELPSTGGIGTTVFYVPGSALVLCAVVLLVTRRRMRDRR